MLYPVDHFVEFLIAVLMTAAPILLVIWLVVAVFGAFRQSPSPRDQVDSRAWDQGREIGRLEQEIVDLKRRIGDLERRQQPFAGD